MNRNSAMSTGQREYESKEGWPGKQEAGIESADEASQLLDCDADRMNISALKSKLVAFVYKVFLQEYHFGTRKSETPLHCVKRNTKQQQIQLPDNNRREKTAGQRTCMTPANLRDGCVPSGDKRRAGKQVAHRLNPQTRLCSYTPPGASSHSPCHLEGNIS